MKTSTRTLVVGFIALIIAMVTIGISFAEGPPACTKSENWKFMINNAYRTASDYATKKNPNAVFISLRGDHQLIYQFGGKYEGKYLLKILVKSGPNTSLAMLLPKFDVNKSTDSLDDEKTQWKVVVAKYNGREF